jgi:dihydrofolate reductase
MAGRQRTLDVELYATLEGYAYGRESPAYFGYDGPDLQARIEARLAEPHEMVMGANTYRQLARYVAEGDDPSFPRMTELPKVVFSSTLSGEPALANSTFVSEPVATALPRLKAEPGGPLRVIGSLSLTASLFAAGLVDRVTVVVFPLVLGETGEQPILRGLPDLPLELLGTEVLDGRLVVMEYGVGR